MSDHLNINDDAGLGDGDAVVRPETIGGVVEVNLAPATVVLTAVPLTVTTGPGPTTAGVETEYVRTIRYSRGTKDGIRYVEVVDEKGEHVASGMGEAADALVGLLEYLLPADHPEYPTDMG